MQQTQNLKLNLIETSDPLSPAPLNENAQKLEAALLSKATALDARLKVFEAKKFAYGTYVVPHDQTAEVSVQIGFTPIMVFVHQRIPHGAGILALPGDPASVTNFLRIVEGGFVSTSKYNINYEGEYNYFALG